MTGVALQSPVVSAYAPPSATRQHDDWRSWSRQQRDAAYNNSAAVAESPAWLAKWSARSTALRAMQPESLDQRYGPAERNCVDIFRSGVAGAPMFVFIHGGYWQRNSKEMFSCMAEGLLAHGVDVALPGYTLAPQASLADIVTEIRQAVRWLHANAGENGTSCSRLVVSGWSAGAHLAASCMDMEQVNAGLAISGVFDLAPIAQCYLNEALRLPLDAVAALSPIHYPPAQCGSLAVTWGLNELPELQRQSQEFAAAWAGAGIACTTAPIDGANHFTILNELCQPDGALVKLALNMMS